MERFEQATSVAMTDEQRYLFEGAKGIEKDTKQRFKEGSRITEAALSNARGRDQYEIRTYYNDLLKKHGARILPYSTEILEARDYQDAVNRYLRIAEKLTPSWDPELIMDLDNPTIWDFVSKL